MTGFVKHSKKIHTMRFFMSGSEIMITIYQLSNDWYSLFRVCFVYATDPLSYNVCVLTA